jgi:hypothetical protein
MSFYLDTNDIFHKEYLSTNKDSSGHLEICRELRLTWTWNNYRHNNGGCNNDRSDSDSYVYRKGIDIR